MRRKVNEGTPLLRKAPCRGFARKTGRLGVAFALVTALFILLSNTALQEGGAPRRLTLMVYMCGSSLESKYGSASTDMEEMKAAMASNDVSLLVMTGGSTKWVDGIDANKTCITQIAPGRDRVVDTRESMSMGDSDTLTYFLQFGMTRFPARDYALIIWDHGEGPLEGVCIDELFSGDKLSMSELTRALAEAQLPRKLAWIGFDACLMSTLEVADQISPYAEYMVASQEREPPSGWNYGFLTDIEQDADGAATGARIVDAYLSTELENHPDLTLSCVDLSMVGVIEEYFDNMYRKIASDLNRDTFSNLARLRYSATGFGKSVQPGRSEKVHITEDGYDLVDIVSLCECYADKAPEDAESVKRTVEHAVVSHSENLSGCCGLSVYHPFRNQAGFNEKWQESYRKLDFCPGYTAFVEHYGQIMSSEHLVLWNDLTDIQILKAGQDDGDDEHFDITLCITDDQAANLASARLVILARNIYDEADEAYFQVYSTADVSIHDKLLVAAYDGKSMQITDKAGLGTLTGSISYRVTESDTYLVNLYPVEQDGTRWETPIIAEYVRSGSDELSLKGYQVYDELVGAYTSRADVNLSTFKGITFINDYRVPTANAADEWLPFVEWTPDTHVDMQQKARYTIDRTASDPTFALDPHRAEDLYGAYELTDTQGNVYLSELVPLLGKGVQHCAAEMALGTDVPYVCASMLTSWEDRFIALAVNVANLSDYEQSYALFDITANDREGDPVLSGDSTLLPGEVGQLYAFIDAESFGDLYADEALREISGVLYVSTLAPEGDRSYFLSFSAAPMLPLDILYHDENALGAEDPYIEDLPLEMIGMEQSPFSIGARVMAQPAASAGNARIIVNIVVGNNIGDDVQFYVSNVNLNGVTIDAPAFNAMGTGDQDAQGKFSIAPGESTAANIVLDHADVFTLGPEVSLHDIDLDLHIGRLVDGNRIWNDVFPVHLTTDVPLDAFYDDATALPSRDLVSALDESEAFGAQSARGLFAGAACDIMLQGVFIEERSYIMLLLCANPTDGIWYVALGQAGMDGNEAVIGCTENVYVTARNDRVLTRGLDKALWEVDSGIALRLEPGESRYVYVTVRPAADAQVEVSAVTLRAYMYDTANPMDGVYYGDAEIRSEEPGPLEKGVECIAPASDFSVTPGIPLAIDSTDVFAESVLVPAEDAGAPDYYPLTFELPEGERVEAGYYALMRKVDSDAVLADMNIIGDSNLSFADGLTWLLYEAVGDVSISEDGRTVSAILPGRLPVILAGDERLPLTVSYIYQTEGGSYAYEQLFNKLSFTSVALPGAVLPLSVNTVILAYDPRTRVCVVDNFNADGDPARGALREVALKDVLVIRSDSPMDEWTDLLGNGDGYKLQQVQLLDSPRMQLAMAAIDNAEEYCVTLYYRNSAGEVKCTPPQPLVASAE